MKQFFQEIKLETKQQFEVVNITTQVQEAVAASGVTAGIMVVRSPHTTASIRLNHAEPLLVQDIMHALYRLVPQDMSYNHDLFELRESASPNERSNGHAHVKGFLLGSSESLIVEQGKILLGERQSIFFVEFDGGRARTVQVKVLGE